MFQFFIHIHILLFVCAPLIKGNSDERIQWEMNSFAPYLAKITDPEARGELRGQLGWLIRHAIKADDLLKERGVWEWEKNDCERNLKIMQVPLVFRNYIPKIEAHFPNVNATIPANATKNPSSNVGILQRKYNWIHMLTDEDCSKNVYMKLIKPALKNYFFSQENITVEKDMKHFTAEEREKYNEVIDRFCEGIALAADYVDSIISYDAFGAHPGNDLLRVFEKAYNNKYVRLFYEALVYHSGW